MSLNNLKEKKPLSIGKIRENISHSFSDYLDGEYGIKLLIARYDLPKGMDCFDYVFGINESQCKEIVNNSPEIRKVTPLALAVYGFSEKIEKSLHVGVVTPELRVISKWGHGPVFEHPPENVPLSYGPIRYRLIDITEISKYFHPTLVEFLEKRKIPKT